MPNQTKKISPLAKCVAIGISLLMGAYGLFIISAEHYYGRPTKLGGAEVSADGAQAIIIGIAMIVLGLTPLSLLAKTATAAGLWAGSCMILGIVLFLAPFYVR